MRQGGKILAIILNELKKNALPGVTKKELELQARRLCLKYHVQPSFLSYNGYPAAVCVSVNDEVVHGIPDETKLKKGDLVSLDMGVKLAGFHTDSAISFICGKEDRPEQGSRGYNAKDEKIERLIKTAEQCFYSAVKLIKDGVHLGDVSAEIQRIAEAQGYGVIRMLVGHGIGREVHEEPHVPNFGKAGTGPILKSGMTLAIEPMLTSSDCIDVELGYDNWTYSTSDGSLATHFEHTILVTESGCEILTKP